MTDHPVLISCHRRDDTWLEAPCLAGTLQRSLSESCATPKDTGLTASVVAQVFAAQVKRKRVGGLADDPDGPVEERMRIRISWNDIRPWISHISCMIINRMKAIPFRGDCSNNWPIYVETYGGAQCIVRDMPHVRVAAE
jgi:hypothetical protein